MSPAQGIVSADMSKMDWDNATHLQYPIDLYLLVAPASAALETALVQRFSLDPQQTFAKKGTCTKGTSMLIMLDVSSFSSVGLFNMFSLVSWFSNFKAESLGRI